MKPRFLLTLIILIMMVVSILPGITLAQDDTTTYSEAPMLAELVASGDLPPVEERLPENPLVVEPVERVGVYGGTWHQREE